MFKNLLLSLGTITVVGGIAVVGTQALLSDNVSLINNTYTVGSVDLQIWDGSIYTSDNVTGFTETNILPGETRTNIFRLRNNNSGAGLAIEAQAVNVMATGLTTAEVEITITPINAAGDVVGYSVTQNLTIASGWQTVTSLMSSVSEQLVIPSGGNQRFKMDVKILDSVSTAGSSIQFDFNFTGTQVVTP